MRKIQYNISKDYTVTPGGRYEKDGKFSGEDFRKNVLIPMVEDAIKNDMKIYIDLDGVFGYATSFLDESFGILAKEYIDYNLIELIEFKSEDRMDLKKQIYKYMEKHIK